jgi:hypothetical protein
MTTQYTLWAALALATAGAPERAAEETWETANVDGARVGYVHTTVRETDSPDGRLLRAASELNLTFRRYNATVQLRMEHGTDETPDGRVVRLSMRQFQGGGRQVSLTGTVEEGRLHFVVDGGRIDRRVPWREDVVGVAGREHLFERRRPKPGDRFTFFAYEPTVTAAVPTRVAVKERETVGAGKDRQTLLRVELTPDKLEARNGTIQLPRTVVWLDEAYAVRRREVEMEGLGTVVLTRSTREAALSGAGEPGRTADLGANSLVPLGRRIADPYATRSAVYRITFRGDGDPATTFASDGHQEVRAVRGNSFELHVHPARPGAAPAGDEPGPEFLGSSYYLDAANARVRELARLAAGGERDPWRRAQSVERWVHQAMRVDNAAAFEPASRVARDLRGDCRSYAVLTAAMCRAAGVPARTAVGLLYVQRAGGPQLGFHMWTEVWAGGQWLGLDATLGRGGVSATHLKIADHSWDDTRSLTPLLPVGRVLGKVAVEVVRIGPGG